MLVAVVDLSDVIAGLVKIEEAARDLRPVFKAMKAPLGKDLEQHFMQREGPEGEWPRYASSTAEKISSRSGGRTKKGGFRKRTLRRLSNQLGRLKHPSTWKWAIGNSSIEATSRPPWSGVHQEGGRVGRGASVPARTFMWASDRPVLDDFRDLLAAHLAEAH